MLGVALDGEVLMMLWWWCSDAGIIAFQLELVLCVKWCKAGGAGCCERCMLSQETPLAGVVLLLWWWCQGRRPHMWRGRDRSPEPGSPSN